MITVLVAIDTVCKLTVASPLRRRATEIPLQFAVWPHSHDMSDIPKCSSKETLKLLLMAVIHDAYAFLTAATPRTSKGSNGAAERAVQAVEGMARTLSLDLPDRTKVAVGSDVPITSWVRHASMVVESLPSWYRRWKDGVRTTVKERKKKKQTSHLCLPFAETVMWKDPTIQLAKLRSSWGYGLWLGRSQTSNAHLIGARMGIVVARTIRRLPASEREEASLVVAMRSTPVAARPADVAAGDAPTVTRHAGERG